MRKARQTGEMHLKLVTEGAFGRKLGLEIAEGFKQAERCAVLSMFEAQMMHSLSFIRFLCT